MTNITRSMRLDDKVNTEAVKQGGLVQSQVVKLMYSKSSVIT